MGSFASASQLPPPVAGGGPASKRLREDTTTTTSWPLFSSQSSRSSAGDVASVARSQASAAGAGQGSASSSSPPGAAAAVVDAAVDAAAKEELRIVTTAVTVAHLNGCCVACAQDLGGGGGGGACYPNQCGALGKDPCSGAKHAMMGGRWCWFCGSEHHAAKTMSDAVSRLSALTKKAAKSPEDRGEISRLQDVLRQCAMITAQPGGSIPSALRICNMCLLPEGLHKAPGGGAEKVCAAGPVRTILLTCFYNRSVRARMVTNLGLAPDLPAIQPDATFAKFFFWAIHVGGPNRNVVRVVAFWLREGEERRRGRR